MNKISKYARKSTEDEIILIYKEFKKFMIKIYNSKFDESKIKYYDLTYKHSSLPSYSLYYEEVNKRNSESYHILHFKGVGLNIFEFYSTYDNMIKFKHLNEINKKKIISKDVICMNRIKQGFSKKTKYCS